MICLTRTFMFFIFEGKVVTGITINSSCIPVVCKVLPGPALIMVQRKGTELADVHPVLPRVRADDVLTQARQVKRKLTVEKVNADPLSTVSGCVTTSLGTS